MAEIKCPMCGKPNPDELDVCQFCEARLKPLTDELSRSQPPIQPGEQPKEVDTSQLEPVLPQWLREVRQQARDSSEEETEQVSAEEEAAQPEESANLLAGLQSQSEDDEEIPDWLAGLRGESAQAAPEETFTEEDDLAALKSMLGEEAPEAGESDASALPGWISDLGADDAGEQEDEDELSGLLAGYDAKKEPVQTEAQPAASESDFEWGADYEADSGPQAESTEDAAPIDTELPGWLQGTDEEAKSESESGLPDWMRTEEPAQPPPPLVSKESIDAAPQEEVQSAAEGDMPDWLASLGEESTEPFPQQEPAQPAAEGETPDWLTSLGEESAEAIPQEAELSAAEGDMPDWLSSLGDESGSLEGEGAPSGDVVDEVPRPSIEGETPDWLSSMGEGAIELEGSPDEAETPAWATEESTQEEGVLPAFVEAEGAPLPTGDGDDIFSMEMPDWLSAADAGIQVEGQAPAASAEAQEDDLRPAELPGWVQAMRPVESVISESDGGAAADQPMEERGPLAGLRGVLPAVPGVGPSSKPEAYSIKLQASEEQQSNAAMLEQMLAAETNPKPIATQPVVLSQRFLRWIIAIVLLLVVGGSVFTGTQMNPLPTGAPPETSAALRYIQESLPADAPVLLIFDYDAALAGELEATAAPLVDHMLLLKHPRLSLIASKPMGAGLAERFMANTQSGHNYQSGQQVVNLGYLPGGAAGVLAFAENPAIIKPTSINGESAWDTPALQGVRQLSDFAAIILLTNEVETARIWIEQTEPVRGETRFLVISSAQSGPMILPYVQSGQVDGIVSGLDGSAPIERVNSGRPGMVRRYWDAYGLGLLAALAMISSGSLWSLVSGWQERRKEQGEA